MRKIFTLWEGRNYAQSNNCQNLNIWTPALDDAKRPVMVWLYGGEFEAGNSAMKQAVSEGCKIYSWSPVKDGDLLPDDIGTSGFSEQAKDIPVNHPTPFTTHCVSKGGGFQ